MAITDPRALWKARLLRAVVGILPSHIKRIIFVATVSKIFRGGVPITDATVQHLNDIMGFYGRKDAVHFSSIFSDMLWNPSLSKICTTTVGCPNTALNQEDIESVIERIKKELPQELRYGDAASITEDLRVLIRERDAILSSQ